MKNPCRHRQDRTVDVGGVLWCKECGAIYTGDPGTKPRWKSPKHSTYDLDHAVRYAKSDGRKELQNQLLELLGVHDTIEEMQK